MLIYLGIAVLVGLSIVFQSGINQQIAQKLDLSSALFFNGLLTWGACATLFALATIKPHWLPEIVRPQSLLPTWSPWMIPAGLMGFTIVFGMPLAINKIGAVRVITVVIAVQIFGALIWDYSVFKTPASLTKLIGALITLVGALLTVVA